MCRLAALGACGDGSLVEREFGCDLLVERPQVVFVAVGDAALVENQLVGGFGELSETPTAGKR